MKALLALSLLLCLGSALAIKAHWTQLDRAAQHDLVSVRVVLTQRNLAILEHTLLDVSDTTSSNYGKWWSPERISDLVAPPKEVSQFVAAHLKKQGAMSVTNLRDSIKLVAPVSVVERLFQTSLFNFQHKTQKSKRIIRAVGGYSIPDKIEEHVDFVAGLYEFPQLRKVYKATKPVDGVIIPATVNNLYQIPPNIPTHINSSICLGEYENDRSFNKKDLKKFTEEVGIPDFNVSHIVGPYHASAPDDESSLDVQYGGAIGQNTTVWFWTVDEWLLEFALDLFAADEAPLVVSISWGWPEPNQCDITNCSGSSLDYVTRTNVEYQKIGLRGITLLAASGDQGAPGDSNPDCSGKGAKALSTIFPGASPWVVSVGATMLTESNLTEVKVSNSTLPPICSKWVCATSTTELVCTYPDALITTGGGFSNYVAQPAYQAAAVNAYFAKNVTLPNAKSFNRTNRGFPDVSALGHNYLIYVDGQWEQVDGTSCSSPVFAAIISHLNAFRLNNNKPPLGFVLPLLYQAYAADPTIYTDITTGNNKCTEDCCGDGYEAAVGWDPVTGLGTPNFPKLLKFVANLP